MENEKEMQIRNLSAMKNSKEFCVRNKIEYPRVEDVWLNLKSEAKDNDK